MLILAFSLPSFPSAAVDRMRFLPTKKYGKQLLNRPDNLPTAKQIPGSSYRKPDVFLQNSVRVFCRSFDSSKRKQLKASYKWFISELIEEVRYPRVEFEEYDRSSNNTPEVGIIPTVSQTSEKYDDREHEHNKRQRYNS
jgi:hypothetical protein